MILCDRDLKTLGPKLVEPFDAEMVNPASIDIRVGYNIIIERLEAWHKIYIGDLTEKMPFWVFPGDFVLVETLERLKVPNGYAMECKLKSSRAREGWNHSLAFWFDPGWDGVDTLELKNITKMHTLKLWPGLRIVQLIYHRLSGDAERPYEGHYQNAAGVEQAKPEKSNAN